jgi:hypothetical protein
VFIAICLGDPVQQFYRLAASLKVIQFAAFYHWATLSGPLDLLSIPPARWALALLLGVLGQARRGSSCGVGLRVAWLHPRALKGGVCKQASKNSAARAHLTLPSLSLWAAQPCRY